VYGATALGSRVQGAAEWAEKINTVNDIYFLFSEVLKNDRKYNK
jgi:hypothetical protein